MNYNSNIIFKVKNTKELTSLEIKQINKLYLDIFQDDRNEEQFYKKFLNKLIGFSYHGLIVKDNVIIGTYNIIPYEYIYFGKKFIFGLSVDTMISQKEKVDLTSLKNVSSLVYQEILKNNIFFVLGFPNKNFHPIQNRLLGWQNIGVLNYYILPLNFFKFFLFKKIIYVSIMIFNNIISLFFNNKDFKKNIFLNSNDVLINDRFNKSYKSIVIDDIKFFYKIIFNKGKYFQRTLYLLNSDPLNMLSTNKFIKHCLNKEIDNIDCIVFASNYNPQINSMVKLPLKMIKNPLFLCGKILDNTKIDKNIFNIDNWLVNLSNNDHI
tara:strand:+ start:640 stop:1605 length:966 start_codon:yes stop_codon:yes gene_type:complete